MCCSEFLGDEVLFRLGVKVAPPDARHDVRVSMRLWMPSMLKGSGTRIDGLLGVVGQRPGYRLAETQPLRRPHRRVVLVLSLARRSKASACWDARRPRPLLELVLAGLIVAE